MWSGADGILTRWFDVVAALVVDEGADTFFVSIVIG